MPMTYSLPAIAEPSIPRAGSPVFQHLVDIYAGETNKVSALWAIFGTGDLPFRPHPRSSSAGEIMKHELLSARRFFAEFLGSPEPPPGEVLPWEETALALCRRMVELAVPRLGYVASRTEAWWLERTRFFDVIRERIWIFWRRVLHTAHHRTQLSVYARLLGRPVPPTYGPTADVTWTGADPTSTAAAAGR